MNLSFFKNNFITQKITQALLTGSGSYPTLNNDVDGNFLEKAVSFISHSAENALLTTYTLFMKLVIVVGRFVLNVVDFILIFVRQFIGMNADFSSIESVTSDKIFDFIFNETIIKIIKYIIIIGLVLIVLFSIIGILKAEYGNVSGEGNSKKHVFVNALKSCFLMVIVPVVSIMAIICSNAILGSLYMATNGGQDITIGTYIWQASTYQANAFRSYADNDDKIPITFNFSNLNDDGSQMNLDSVNIDGTIKDMEDSFRAFKNQSAFKKGLFTHYMFNNQNYLSIGEVEIANTAIEAADPEAHSAYYDVYDENLQYKKVEYYVMADAIDHCLVVNNDTKGGFFYKSINDVYENHCQVYGTDRVTDLPIEKGTKNGVLGYFTKVHYNGENDFTEYFSPENSKDEAEGTVYTLCYAKLIETETATGESVKQEILMPLIVGEDFSSEYVYGSGSLVVAKGVFDRNGYPTAIRTTDSGNIQFYRENIFAPTVFDMFPTITYELPEGQKESFPFRYLRKGIETFIDFDSDQLIPYFYFNFDIFSIFSKTPTVVTQLNSGNFEINYNMSGKLTTYNVYDEAKVNPIVLLFGSVLLLKVLTTIIFALIARIFDMVALAITYPGVVSAIPLDGGTAMGSWTKMLMNRIISIYGITIGVNFVMLIMPTIWSMKFFTPAMIANYFNTNHFIVGWTATFLNLLVNVLFTLVAFSLIKTFSQWLNYMLDPITSKEAAKTLKDNKKKDSKKWKNKDVTDVIDYDLMKEGEAMYDKMQTIVTTTGAVVSGKILMDTTKKALGKLSDFIPGKPVYTVGKDIAGNVKYHNKLRHNKEERKSYMNDLNSGTITNQNDLADRHNKFVKNSGLDK